MRVVIHKNGMLEMTIINVIFLTNVEKCFIFGHSQLLPRFLGLYQICRIEIMKLKVDNWELSTNFCLFGLKCFCSLIKNPRFFASSWLRPHLIGIGVVSTTHKVLCK